MCRTILSELHHTSDIGPRGIPFLAHSPDVINAHLINASANAVTVQYGISSYDYTPNRALP